jgi:hypothetical protein
MTKMSYSFLFAFLIFVSLFFSPQSQSKVVQENNSWWSLVGKQKYQEFSLFHESQLRYSHEEGGMQQVIIRPGILKSFNSNEVGFLMGYIQTGNLREYRPTFQYSYLGENFTSRNRLEFRNWEGHLSASVRFRSLLRKEFFKSENFSLLIWDEAFVNLTRETHTGNRFFERNRIFVGTNFTPTNSPVRFELGYLNQYIPRSLISHSEHNLSLTVFY